MGAQVIVVETPVPEDASEDDLARVREMLSAEESARLVRFVRPIDRVLYGTAHVLARRLLSLVRPRIAPGDWAFERTAQGRPLPWANGEPGPSGFSLSHTRGLVCCAVGQVDALGVDAEVWPPLRPATQSMFTWVLTPAETARVEAAGHDRDRVFLNHWTLKEAYSKGRGLGLHLPFEQCEFDLDSARPVLVRAPDEPDPSGWALLTWTTVSGHVLALAVRPRDTQIVQAHVPFADLVSGWAGALDINGSAEPACGPR